MPMQHPDLQRCLLTHHPGLLPQKEPSLRPGSGFSRRLGQFHIGGYSWRKEFGGLKSDQVRRMKELETENQRLRKAIADLTLDKLILQEAARGNF
ncbi:hypothetical protein G4G93_32235 [Methylobacterium sp. DB0501]|nr:hypothetical protein [Methylobacterium sp. DB0501]